MRVVIRIRMLVLMRFFAKRPKGVTKHSLIDHTAAIYTAFFQSKLRSQPG